MKKTKLLPPDEVLDVQQGDVLLHKLPGMPEGTPTVLAKVYCVLAHGESGHSHVVDCPDSELIAIGERMLLKLAQTATVQHEEHKPVTLSPGIWEIGRVQEYDWLSKMQRPVVD